MGKREVFSIKWCFRSVFNHPFLLGMLCFLIFLYRTSPFIFSLLVSASPVLVCTAVLLGTLLSFGQSSIPEIEMEVKTTCDAFLIKKGASGGATVFEKNERYYAEYSDKKMDVMEELIGKARFTDGKLDESLMKEILWETELENCGNLKANRESGNMDSEQTSEWDKERIGDGEAMENHYASLPKMSDDEHLELDDETSVADSFDSERVNIDTLDSPPHSHEDKEKEEDEEEEEDDDSDLGSDVAESSSPDASMADIMPMLDELHPLLDEDAPQPVHTSHDGSDAASELSLEASTSSHESDDEFENHEVLEVANEDIEDGEDEEDAQGDYEEQAKSAITWTEEDQKNLMDLGSSEIERNQRLENLILRRKSRKNISMVPEINLIDFENSDFSFNIPPISTVRQNPFDLPHGSYDNSGIPPIPGSAPSILLARRNPFDIPYDSSEKKPNLMRDGIQESFSMVQPREQLFRRRESFNVGPSFFAPNRQDRQETKWRPYFAPERMVSEESSYSIIQRQSSELSESKVSSVPETESLGSVELEDRKLSEEDTSKELEPIVGMTDVLEERSSMERERVSNGEPAHQENSPQEPESSSEMEHVGHGSLSSEDEGSLELAKAEKSDSEVDEIDFQFGDVEHCHKETSATQPLGVEAAEYHPNPDNVERYSSISSSSSLSEVSERVFNETGAEQPSMLEARTSDTAEEPRISIQTSLRSNDSIATLVDGVLQREPVYDSSPTGITKNFSSSYISSSDVHADSDLSLPPLLVKRTVSFIERQSPIIHDPVNEHESGQIDVVNMVENDDICSGLSNVDQILKESVEASVEDNPMGQHAQGQVPCSNADKNQFKSSEHENPGKSEEKHLLIWEKESLVQSNSRQSEGQFIEEHSMNEEETVRSPNSDADDYHEAYEKLISTPSAGGNVTLFYDKIVQEPTFEHLIQAKVQNSSILCEEGRTVQIVKIREIQEVNLDISSNVDSPLSPDFISIPSSASEAASPRVDMQTIIHEEDEIKNINEEMMVELDGVGGFSVRKWKLGSNDLEKHVDCVGETSDMRVDDINLAEVNKIEHEMHLEKSREVIDTYEEDIECVSKITMLESGAAEHNDILNKELTDGDSQDSSDQDTSEKKIILPKEDFLCKKAESMSMDTIVTVEGAEALYRARVDIDTASGMLQLKTGAQISDEDIKWPIVLEPPETKFEIGNTSSERYDDGKVNVNSKVSDSENELSILEVTSVEVGGVPSGKPYHGVESPDNVHSTKSGKSKGKYSKSSSSSSSFESSSSDSDRE
ncbi:uncharacterized protein [Henckelia pumila]|uniref:uncharacterized protein n=1 Tax=Henckelia pumila TaxID=405737 RepID=UPI003C6DB905